MGFGPFCILGEILDKILLKALKISRFKSKIYWFWLWFWLNFSKGKSKKLLTMGDDYIGHPALSNIGGDILHPTPRSTPKTVKLKASGEWRLTGGVHTANCVGQNLSTFAQRWFKCQQCKLNCLVSLTQWWAKLNKILGNNLPNNLSKMCVLGKFYATLVKCCPII